MNILVVMIPLSLLIVIGAAAFFFWAVNHEQFEDIDSSALLPMEDGLPTPEQPASPASKPQQSTTSDTEHP